MKLLVDVDLESATRSHQAIIDRLENPGGLLRMLGSTLEDYEADLFATSGHGEWQADDPVTARLKGSGSTLVDGGRLLRNLTHAETIGSDAVHVNQGDAFYARFLRDGERGMPKRNPALPPDRGTVEDWATKTAAYLVDGDGA